MSNAPAQERTSLESLVGRVADEYLARRQRGERPNVSEYTRRYPQYAEVLSQILSSLELVELASAAGSIAADPTADATAVGQLGDFHILRELGRGGMGVVYEARQLSLDRRVALKVLPFAAALDPKLLRRFKNEAEAAAHLHHTNIVPVFCVGCDRGVHFFAMQFIEGRTLAQVIADLRTALAEGQEPDGAAGPAPGEVTPPIAGLTTDRSKRRPEFYRTVARLGVQAAEALEYAHQEGIVHRDIKPANLLVDAKFNVWVTDFGLARLQNEAGLTVSGDLVGTLRYMSPEQARGSATAVDHRTDVYALGATLYELLVSRPAFEGNDRQELLRQIAYEDPRPPRRLNPAVPAELETIVLKALEKDAKARYATARELADDLRRFLEYKPIRARRSSWLERARKWGRRHRPAVWAAGVTLSVFAVVLLMGGGWILRDRAARQAKHDGDVDTALKALRDARLGGKWPQVEASARGLKDLLQEGKTEPSLSERAKALLGDVEAEGADRRLLDRLEESRRLRTELSPRWNNQVLPERLRPAYQQAFREYGLSLETTPPQEAAARLRGRPPHVRDALLAALDHWMILARALQAPEAAWLRDVLSAADSDPWRQNVREARERSDRQALEQLARDADVVAQPPEELFMVDYSLRGRGAVQAAVTLLRRAREVFPGDFWINYNLAEALQECRPPQYDEAISCLSAAAALQPANPQALFQLGRALARRARWDEATVAIRRCLELKPEFAEAHLLSGMVLHNQGRLDAAVAALRRAIDLEPGDHETYLELGNTLRDQNRVDDAVASFRRAIELKPDFAEAHCNLGLALQSRGEFAVALAALEQGHALGVRQGSWRYPSGKWVADCRRFIKLDARLPAVFAGQARPADTAQAHDFARVCQMKHCYLDAARLLADAFASDPRSAEDVAKPYRYDAACAAALAGCGRGERADQLGSEERARWRRQALAWLEADLRASKTQLDKAKPDERRQVQLRLRHWQTDSDLAGLRDPAALAKLDAEEQRACARLWSDVAKLLARAGATRSAESEALKAQ